MLEGWYQSSDLHLSISIIDVQAESRFINEENTDPLLTCPRMMLLCRGGRCPLNMSRLKRPPVGVVWKLREGGASSGVVLVTRSWFKITRSIVKRSPVAE
ncbi:hypothetical protein TNCV_818001 [Trichonephila clavipes]|nr:hypothetical protein TNCV_818001 [Trichonephila clavipes]